MKICKNSGLCWIIASMIACGGLTGCTSEKPAQKLVVLTFDDAVRSHLEYVAPMLKEKGFGATFFVCNLWMSDTVNFMQWDDVAELYRMGFEIGNHSWDHAPLYTEEAIATMEVNLGKVDSALFANGVPRPVSFGYPSNFFAPATVDKVRELGYKYGRRGMQPEIPYGKIAQGPLFDPEVNDPLLIPTTADAYPQWTLAHFKTIIDRATEGKAIVLQFHGVPDIAHPWVHTDPLLFRQFMDYLEESGVKVIALKELEQYLDLPEVEDPALQYTNGVPGQYNPCPEEADVWVLAGQSNMQGAGRSPDTLINPHIWMMNLDDKWSIAQTPLHRIFEASAPAYQIAHYELYGETDKTMERHRQFFEENAKKSREKPIGGVGPGIYFARHLLENTGKPIGLIPCALGGSTINQWNPAGKAQGDSSLYGAMLSRIQSTNTDQIKGLVWIQGESEALIGEPETYEQKLLNFIDSFREDLDKPGLPILIVQIGRMINLNPEMGLDWEAIREIQRQVAKKRENIYLSSGIDLELDDCIHYSTSSNQILGTRLGEIALTYVYGIPGHGSQINPESIELKKDPVSGSYFLHLFYSGVTGSLKASGRASGFELRFGPKTSWFHVISRVETDPDRPAALKLFLSAIPDKPADFVCGPGINPYMNISDLLNMPIPAFGPIEIDFKSLKDNPFIIE